MEKQSIQLVQQAQSGDTQALNRLFSLWYDRVYNIAWKYFADEDLALEVCQRSFLAMQRHLSKLNDPTKFKYWLYRTVVNQCHMEHRRKKQQQNLKEAYPQNHVRQAPERPDQLYHQAEITRHILYALQQLPDEQRTIIIMKEYEGLKFREIAEVLDISENTAKSRLYYGLQNMKKILLSNQASKEICHG